MTTTPGDEPHMDDLELANDRPALPRGVMLNAYPRSLGQNGLAETVAILKRPEFKDAFSLFYILPTLFHTDLDRGFSVIDYDLNEDLVSPGDLRELSELGMGIKLDLVLNHLSVRSHQFRDLLQNGDASPYRDFFIDWDLFWKDHGRPGEDGHIVPGQRHLEKLFMRKPGLPLMKLRFPDGSTRAYWNTFYQKVEFSEITAADFESIRGIKPEEAEAIARRVKILVKEKDCLESVDMKEFAEHGPEVRRILCRKREFLGQMDLNARSEMVWDFYDKTLEKLGGYGANIVRLDAFAYLHKEPGRTNFFNRPGTWDYLRRLCSLARERGAVVIPEIHAEYGTGIHEEISREGYPTYDFFLPGLLIDALDRGDNRALVRWISEIQAKGLVTINMLGCHDGIPLLDLKGKQIDGAYRPGLLDDELIEAAMERIVARGGRTKNLYDAEGKKVDYYQVNATYFSALGEDEQKLLLARAIQMFMPGLPQVWYLDLFAGTNDYEAADQEVAGRHKEINRTDLSLADIESGLQRQVVLNQLKLIRLRNTSPAFEGELQIVESPRQLLHLVWQSPAGNARLRANLKTHAFTVSHGHGADEEILLSF